MKIGSEAHKELFCRSFMESYQEYEPAKLPWPTLDAAALERLRGIPFWQEALRVERRAGVMVTAFAETISDPMIREAIALQAKEETRHGRLIQFLIEHYDVKIDEPPAAEIPANIEQEFIDFGFGECLDSYFAFGMFGLARETNYFPEALFTIFDPILHEEARHIVFFTNWVSYLQVQQGRGFAPLRGLYSGWHYGRALLHLAQIFGNAGDGTGEVFTATGAGTFADNLTPDRVFSMCLRENAQRMSVFDERLLQPRLLPRLSAIALRTLRLLPRRQPAPQANIGVSES
ncbi:MAG: ferritin-like domain-containing protein [Leptolyngbya sp. BL-A-14]